MDESQIHCASKQKPDSKANFIHMTFWKRKTAGVEHRSGGLPGAGVREGADFKGAVCLRIFGDV